MFPHPLQNGRSNRRKDRARAFMTMNVVVEDGRILHKYQEVFLFTSADGHTEVSILLDSGTNVHMTHLKENIKFP